jgi:hypothetical protein
MMVGSLAAVSLATLLLGAPLTPHSSANEPGGVLANGGDGRYQGEATSVTVIRSGGGAPAGRSEAIAGPPPLCWLEPGPTATERGANGRDQAEKADYYYGAPPGSGEVFDPEYGGYVPEGHADHVAGEAAGVSGRYWYPVCSSEASWEQRLDFYGRYPSGGLYFTGTPPQPPPPPLTVDQLLDVVRDELSVPAPQVGLSPTGFSLVNLDTWVWAEGGTFDPVQLRAESGPNWVEVTVTPQALALSAPHGRQTAPCLDGGTPWTGQPESVDPTCAVTFGRAPGGRIQLPLTVTSQWTAAWRGQDGAGARNGTLPGTTASTVVDVLVQEVQTLVTDAG